MAFRCWEEQHATNIEKIQRAQNKTLRIITGASNYFNINKLQKELKVDPIKYFSKSHMLKYVVRLNPNGLVNKLQINRKEKLILIEYTVTTCAYTRSVTIRLFYKMTL